MNKIWDALINKLHVAIGTVYAGALVAYRWKSGQDLGPGLTNASYAFYAFLLGHAGVYQKWPDQDRPDKSEDQDKQ